MTIQTDVHIFFQIKTVYDMSSVDTELILTVPWGLSQWGETWVFYSDEGLQMKGKEKLTHILYHSPCPPPP